MMLVVGLATDILAPADSKQRADFAMHSLGKLCSRGNSRFLEEGRGAASAGWSQAGSVAVGTGERASGMGECFREKSPSPWTWCPFGVKQMPFRQSSSPWGQDDTVPANELSLNTRCVPHLCKGLGTTK